MIQRSIPQKDIKTYQPKLIGPFTARQVFLGVPGIALALIIFFATRNKIGDAAYLLAIVTGLPFMLFAFYKPYGIPLEKFLKNAAVSFFAPTKRKYVTESPLKEFQEASEKSAKAKKSTKTKKTTKPKNPDFREI